MMFQKKIMEETITDLTAKEEQISKDVLFLDINLNKKYMRNIYKV